MRVMTLCLAGCGLLWAFSSSAQDEATGLASDDDASGYLSAFRQRALDAALQSGARVKGVAYLDDQGRLHERAMFSSEADVRGIQVESYLEAMGGQDTLDAIQVSDEARCQLWTGSGSQSGLVTIQLTSDAMREASERALHKKQETLLVSALQSTLRAQGYRVLAPGRPQAQKLSGYDVCPSASGRLV